MELERDEVEVNARLSGRSGDPPPTFEALFVTVPAALFRDGNGNGNGLAADIPGASDTCRRIIPNGNLTSQG